MSEQPLGAHPLRSGAHDTSAGAAKPGLRQSHYVPTWWEIRFPWLVDLLIALDPEPLGRLLAPLGRPLARAIEAVCLPLSAGLEYIGRAFDRVRSLAATLVGTAVGALPLPDILQDWLWLRPFEPEPAGAASAQMLLQRRWRRILAVAMAFAVVIHAGAFALWPTIGIEDFGAVSAELVAIDLPPSVEIPPPPPRISRPAVPVLAPTDFAEDVTIAPTTFEANPVQDLPPPTPEEVASVRSTPTITPFTVAPRILNEDEVRALLIIEYPPLLREAGIGGEIVMWFYLDDRGEIVEMRIARGSGHETLDAAALRVAERIEFAPALNREVHVAAWVHFPIEFRVRNSPEL